ncbi:MAG TPA: Wzz/FepE/Etk N-terminal domain-containing protein [Chloroflexota bacterium]|nr:Wzz/FepE/Etk N-terminal domain-containing protein [Chloroflexota bacterium]
MELREYWQIIWRRRQIIVPLVVVTFIASAIFNLILPPTYKTDTTVHVQAILPPVNPNAYYSEPYYRTVHSEYLTDDLGVIVKQGAFAERVASHILARYGEEVEARDVMNSIASTKRLHRTLKITIATGNEVFTKRIAEAIDDILQRDGGRMLVAGEQSDLVKVNVIDPPLKPTSPSALRRMLDVLLHSAVALVVGTGLAFLLHALDDRIQSESDAAQTVGWPVLGVIPTESVVVGMGASTATGWSGLASRFGRRSRSAAPRAQAQPATGQ